MTPIQAPYPMFFDKDGSPLTGGYVFFGQEGENPRTSPITVYWDEAGTQPATNLRTLNGYIARAGSPTVVYIDTAFSLLVVNARGEQVFYTRSIRTNVNRVRTVNASDYGAIGNGIADDTAAILEASALGVEVEFSEGTYIVNNSVLPNYVRWKGRGSKTIIKWKASSESSNMLALSGLVDASFTGIVFDGNRANQVDSTGYYGTLGGALDDGARVTFNECEFINGRIADLYFSGPTGAGESAEVSIENCRFFDGLVGNATRAAQAIGLSEGIRCVFNNNRLIQPAGPATYGRGGLVLQRPAGSTSLAWGSVRAEGNYFENFGRRTADTLGCIYVYSGSELSSITGNIFRNSYGTAITVKGDCGNTTVTGNSVYGNFSSNSAAFSFFDQSDVYTSSLGRDIVITGNTIRGAEQTSIFIDGARAGGLDDFKNAIIANNVCDSGVRGIHFRNINTLRIQGNAVAVTTGIAIFGEDCSGDISITGNTLADGSVAVDVLGSTSTARISIARNKVSGFAAAIFRLRSAVESFHIVGNEVDGGTTAYQTTGATDLSTIVGNVLVGASGWSRTGTYGRTIWRDGTDGYYTPQDFGAVANGSTDDGPAIQAAVGAVVGAGGVLYFPPGRYAVGGAISLSAYATKRPFELRGAGLHTVIERLDGCGTVFNFRNAPEGTTVRDMRIKVFASTRPTNANNTIVIGGASHALVENVVVDDPRAGAVLILSEAGSGEGPIEGCMVRRVKVYGVPSGANIGVDVGILIAGQQVSRSGIEACEVYDGGRDVGLSPGIGIELKFTGPGCWITDCYAENWIQGFGFAGSALDGYCYDVRASNNLAVNCQVGWNGGWLENSTVTGLVIDMSNQNATALEPIQISRSGNVYKGVIVKNAGNVLKYHARFIGDAANNVVDMDVIDNANSVNLIASFESTTANNRVNVRRMARPAITSLLTANIVQDNTAGKTNTVDIDGLPVVVARTIAGGVITTDVRADQTIVLDTEGAAATDDLQTINGGVEGKIIRLRTTANARDVNVLHGVGNITLVGAADYNLGTAASSLTLRYNGNTSTWCEMGRATV